MQSSFPTFDDTRSASSVLLASLVLPGLATLACMAPVKGTAEGAPEKTTVSVNYGTYSDRQPGWERVTAVSPQVYVQAPIAGDWALEVTGVMDTVSGATPRWHTQHAAFSGASQMNEQRRAGEVKITRYLARSAFAFSAVHSVENDYVSNAMGLEARWSTEDNNRSWAMGLGRASDTIDATSTGGAAVGRHKTTTEVLLGVTQVVGVNDLLQLNLTRSLGSGYFNDPYKTFDQRPDQRDAWVALARWNHYLEPFDAALRSSYRYYTDTFGVQSHTVGVEWVQSAGQWTLTPGLRYYSQSAANFYLDPIFSAQGQYDQVAVLLRAVKRIGESKSTDQRLAAYGAFTASFKLSYAWAPDTVLDLKWEAYKQSPDWHWGGEGSPGLDALNANFVQIGLTHRF